MSQEQAVQNRVKYLEETQNKLTEQVAVMQAQAKLREKVMERKQQEMLKQALRQKRDEQIEDARQKAS